MRPQAIPDVTGIPGAAAGAEDEMTAPARPQSKQFLAQRLYHFGSEPTCGLGDFLEKLLSMAHCNDVLDYKT